MDISVIVPIYNQELHLEKCLSSLLNIKDLQVEIICINDGSDDGSFEIMEKYQRDDSRIKIINKINTGYGDSMNCGITRAEGKYIFFIESDDWLADNALNELFVYAEKFSADIVKGNYYIYNSSQDKVSIYENLKNFQYNCLVQKEDRDELFFVAPSIWSALYRKDFLVQNNIFFLPTKGAAYQDTSFVFKVWAKAEKIVLIQTPIVYYRSDNAESSSNQRNKIFNICDEFKEINRFIEENELQNLAPILVRVKYISYMWNVNRLAKYDKIKFLMVIRKEFRKESYDGNLIKKYWGNADWERIHDVIFNFEEYCKKIIGEKVNSEQTLTLELMRYVTPIYIYGAGQYGRKVLKYLMERKIGIEGFIVTNLDNNPLCIDGVPVIDTKMASYDGLIVIGVSAKYKNEVINELEKKHYNNYIELSL